MQSVGGRIVFKTKKSCQIITLRLKSFWLAVISHMLDTYKNVLVRWDVDAQEGERSNEI